MDVKTATTVRLRLGEGKHVIRLRAIDICGNEVYVTIVVTVDLRPPEVTIVEPEDSSIINVTRVRVTWQATDDTGVAYCMLRVDSEPWIYVGNATEYEVELSRGIHVIYVVACDFAGHVGMEYVVIRIEGEVETLEALESPVINNPIQRAPDSTPDSTTLRDTHARASYVTPRVTQYDTGYSTCARQSARDCVAKNVTSQSVGEYSPCRTLSKLKAPTRIRLGLIRLQKVQFIVSHELLAGIDSELVFSKKCEGTAGVCSQQKWL